MDVPGHAQRHAQGQHLMQIAFRTDASLQIGTGHVMRCLTLADALRERGAQSTFLCRPHTGHLLDLIRQRGHAAIELAPAENAFDAPADPPHAQWLGTDWTRDAQQTRQTLGAQVVDWLVVDHYALDRRWENALRSNARRIMVIDDLADRPHDCELLLDQNLGRSDNDYRKLLSPSTQTLTGPSYALLRPEFAQWREHSLSRRATPQLKNLLITMGGVDQGNATGQVLDALKTCELPADLRITVVMGPHAPWLAQVQAQAAAMPQPTQVLAGVSNMAELMAQSDLCLGAAGSTAWERCCLGLPSVVLVLAPNQHNGAMALKAQGAALSAQNIPELRTLLDAWTKATEQSLQLKQMSQAAARLTDGGGAERLASKLLSSHA